jgi:hypothetical protein
MVQPWLQQAKAWNWLFDHGLVRDRGWTLFFRDNETPTPASTNLRIKPIGPEYPGIFHPSSPMVLT